MIILYHIFIPVLVALIMNGIIYIFKLNKDNKELENYFIPKGYIIGIIWTLIFALLGYVHYLLYTIDNKINIGSISVIILMLLYLLYPLIIAFKKKYFKLVNLISLILGYIVSLIILGYSKYIFIYMIPLLVWISYVNVVYLIEK